MTMRISPSIRAYVRLKLEKRLRRKNEGQGEGRGSWVQRYALENLGILTSVSPVYALTLVAFYFSGSYYHLSKKIWGLRYIFTRKLKEGEQGVGYEMLGGLLMIQMIVQGWMHIKETMDRMNGEAADSVGLQEKGDDHARSGSAEYVNGILLKSRIEKTSHTAELEEKPRYDLKKNGTLGWMQGKQLRKCTLCLEEMKDPSATTCGHIFCWTCIQDWVKEKPECPLCRQHVLGQHVLPLRG